MKLNTSAWRQFWFSSYSPVMVDVFRILLCVAFFARITHFFDFQTAFQWDYSQEKYYFGAIYFVPYLQVLRPPSYEVFALLMDLRLVALLLATIGLFTRASLWIVFATTAYSFFLNQFHYQNHMYFFVLSFFLCALMPVGRRLSMDALIRQVRKVTLPEEVSYWSIRLAQVTLSLVYFFSALQKTSEVWLSGQVMGLLIKTQRIDYLRGAPIMEIMTPQMLAWGVVIAEYFLAVAFWNKRTKPLAFAVGLFFHLSMTVMMKIDTFSQQMLIFYLLFLNPTPVKMVTGALSRGQTFLVWLLQRLDWTRRFTWSEAVARESDACIMREGRISLQGAKAWLFVFSRVLILSPLAWFIVFLCKN